MALQKIKLKIKVGSISNNLKVAAVTVREDLKLNVMDRVEINRKANHFEICLYGDNIRDRYNHLIFK